MNAITTLNIPAFGQRWEEHNGILIAIQNLRGQFRALILPEEEKFKLRDVEIGTYGTKVNGANSIDDGEANTTALAAAGSELCQQIQQLEDSQGNKGFFLGSSGQHHLAFGNEGSRQHFDTDDWHWTSTQYDADDAWCQGFHDGFSCIFSETFYGLARPVRSVIL